GALLGARLDEPERAGGEPKLGEIAPAVPARWRWGGLWAGVALPGIAASVGCVGSDGARLAILPVQPAGDHQMQHQESLTREADPDALADAAHAGDGAADRVVDRRIGRAQQVGAPDADR